MSSKYQNEQARKMNAEAEQIELKINSASIEQLREILSSVFSDVSCDLVLGYEFPPYYEGENTEVERARDLGRESAREQVYEAIRDFFKK
jgi:hypothetical protein